jgi:SAM-dependent methyltransferase
MEYDAERFRAFKHAGWERAARAWDRHWAALTASALPRCLECVGIEPRGAGGLSLRFLDVGCGSGEAVAAARARGADAIGVDFSAAMLARARTLAPSAQVTQADAEALPFPHDGFDAVLCNFSLLHVARPEVALFEMRRVLRPRGRLAATVWAGPDQMRVNGIVREAIAAVAPTGSGVPPGPDFSQHADPARLGAALAALDLVEIGVERLLLTHSLAHVDALWEMVADATVRTSAVLRALPLQTRQRILELMAQALEPYRLEAGEGYAVPAEALLAYGTKR